MSSYPPFDSLIAFDAALRHRSMTLAAAELGLTQSAVSHRLRRLEDFVGTPLLNRSGSGLTTTPAGSALAEGLRDLLTEMAELRARSRAAASPATLKVCLGAALADNWLVRRLPAFTEANPEISVELGVVESEAQARAMDFDVRILWLPADRARASSIQRRLFHEQVFPVASDDLHPGLFPLGDVAHLGGMPILHKGPAGRNDGAEWSWPVWFERLGIEAPVPRGMRFETIGTAIAAALQGAGVVLARSLLVHDALVDGRLRRVLPRDWDVPSSKTHIVRWPAALSGDARVSAFVGWLTEKAGETTRA